MRAWVLLVALIPGALACAAIPLGDAPHATCSPSAATGEASAPCRKHLVVGFFPAIGEAHLNDLASNGEPLTPGLRVADYTLRPLYIAALNFVSLGLATARGWLLEPYDAWDPAPRSCALALLGYCKSARMAEGGGHDEARG
jgi:hypothetical protein